MANDVGTVTSCETFVTCNENVGVVDDASDIALTCSSHNGTFEVTGGCSLPICKFGGQSAWGPIYAVADSTCGGLSLTETNCNNLAGIFCRLGYSGFPVVTCGVPGADGVNANFEFSGCEDYDECAGEGTGHECDSVNGAVCANTIGGYNCTCPSGYSGDGLLSGSGCTYDLLCATNPCDEYATCIEWQGGSPPYYNCTCDDGLTGDGYSCFDAPVITFESGRTIPADAEDEAFLEFGADFYVTDYAACADIIDGDLSTTGLRLTDGVDLTKSVASQVDTSVAGSSDYVLACVDSDGNTTSYDFRIHVSFAEVVAALRDFAHTHTHQKLRAVIGSYNLDLEACPSASSALVGTTWGIGWHPRVLQETFVFCAGSNATPTQDFLAAFMVRLAEEHDIDVALTSDFVTAEMSYNEYLANTYKVIINAKVEIAAPAASTSFGVEQYTCIDTTCPAQKCTECSA
eukprot:INCI14970.1.p1 GENE.INCI14970.1~~INCI14970.1.p1  ORF type:complete len:477 (+),score=58.04 INCI14970.1:52-1431(+)